ncbi:MAG: dihydropteroate synthase [Pseudomonadota bacterium]|nr:dihydropteroate synthase [Pseudomonadota bacterium]
MIQRLNPTGLLSGVTAFKAISEGLALPLAGGALGFSQLETIKNVSNGGFETQMAPIDDVNLDLSMLIGERLPFAGMGLKRPIVMGVVNVTPDSFSGGGFLEAKEAIDHTHHIASEGVDFVDIGGESTRPGATSLSESKEISRVLPVIEAAVAAGLRVSVDTSRASVMRVAIEAGASIINDVTALTGDPDALEVVASSNVSVILMHMQGRPQTMQHAPSYQFASVEIFDWLMRRIEVCMGVGIPRNRIVVDPGIGFGKNDGHNIDLLDRAAMFHGTGCAVAIGVSRKSFIGRLAGANKPCKRLSGTIAATMIALSRGVQIHRVHDVAEARQAIAVWNAFNSGNGRS